MTFRDAYEAFNMPFWYLKFHVYLNDQNDAWCDITINGMLVYSTYIFDDYDTVNTPSIHIHTMPMHVVNYGVDAEGNPAASYKGWFTYPRLIAPTQTVNVSFECTKDVGSGNALYIAGSFNDWTVDENSRLEWHEGNLWSKSITLPVGETVSFKVVLASYENPTSKTWYPDSNIEWTVPNADCNYTIYW